MTEAEHKSGTIQPNDSVSYEAEGLLQGQTAGSQFFANTDVALLGVRYMAPHETFGPTVQEHLNGFLFVKEGRVRLTIAGGEEIGEMGPNDGAVIPRGNTYTLEALDSGDGSPAQVLQFHASDQPLPRQLSQVKREVGLPA